MKKQICKDGTATLYNEHYQQTYHSVHGAITECEQVFLTNSGIKSRLSKGLASNILEIGFGLGLNFLVTAKAAQAMGVPINYIAFENSLINTQQFDSLHYGEIFGCYQLNKELSQLFQRIEKDGSSSRLELVVPQVKLSLLLKCALTFKAQPLSMHAIYLDAFSPTQNPECWSIELLEQLYDSLVPGGSLATYSVQGKLRRTLKSIGFFVEKLVGPPGKREVLIAYR